MIISERIKELRNELGITIKELSEKTKIPYDSLKNYEYGRREPTGQALAALEQFFGVSGSFLYGETDINIWDSNKIMDAVDRDLSTLFINTLNETVEVTSHDRKMVFDILVELRHILASKRIKEDAQKVSLDLLQSVVSISTEFVDACVNVTDPVIDAERIDRLLAKCTNNYSKALTEAKIELSN